MPGTFIMVDGIDGSGKSTIIEKWGEVLEQNNNVFYLKKYWKKHQTFPEPEELHKFEVIISAEPTYSWIGSAIRSEMVRKNHNYSPTSIAKAFSLDRLVLYKRVLLPALNSDKIVIQDRGVSTSLCYQPLQSSELTREYISNLEGNKFALENNPDYFIIADVKGEEAMQRLGLREQQDQSVFEKKDFLQQARESFLSEDFQKYFKLQDTKIKKLDCNKNIDIMKKNSVSLLKSILNI